MSERPKGTRTQEHEIAIDASAEAVWKAITDAEELTRWFVETAKVEPGVGGSFRISWGGGEEGNGDSSSISNRLRCCISTASTPVSENLEYSVVFRSCGTNLTSGLPAFSRLASTPVCSGS